MGLSFVPLVTVQDLIGEASAMDNCLDQYGLHLESGTRRVYSVRKGCKRVADVDLGPHPTDTRMPHIVQIRGPRNRRVDSSVWQATYAWMAAATVVPPTLDHAARRRRQAQQAVRRFWMPHLEAMAGTEHGLHLEHVLLHAGQRKIGSRTGLTTTRTLLRAMNDHPGEVEAV
jgi:hypothetical protein